MADSFVVALDSPRVFDAAASFSGGQFSYAKPRLLGPSQAALLQDCEIEITGQIATRFGTAQVGGSVGAGSLIDALEFMNSPGFVYEVAVSNGSIYKLNGSTWSSIGTLTTTDKPSICKGGNKLFFAAGGDIYQWDGTTLTNLSGDGATQAPRNASLLRWHTGRLVAAGPSIKGYSTDANPLPDAIYFSEILAPNTWSAAAFGYFDKVSTMIQPGNGDGLPITALVPWTVYNIAVFKRRSVWIITADPSLSPADFPVYQVHPTIGCAARRSAVQVGNDILFLSDDGIRSLQQTQASDQQHELTVPLSFPVQDIIDRINWNAASGACATFWRYLYMIALPLDGSSTNNYLLIFNTVTKSWEGIWTGLPINSFAVREVSGVPHLMLGLHTSNKVIEYLDYINPSNWIDGTFQDYNGTSIQPRVKTRAFTFNDPIAMKLSLGGEIEWNNSKGSLTITPILDEVSKASFAVDVSSGGFTPPVTPPFTIPPNGLARKQFDMMQYGEFREVQFDILGTGTGRKELRQITLAGFNRATLVGNS